MPMWFPVAQRIHDVRLFYDRSTRMLQCIPLKFAFASLTHQALRETKTETERQTDRDRETERRKKNNTNNKSER